MIRKEQQRFSLRKYKVGVASVFLGTTLSFMLANGGAVKASELPTQPSSEEKTELVKKDSVSEDSSKKEENVVEKVATTELAETNKVEEGKAASEAKTEEAKFEPVSSEKAEEVNPASTENEGANKETAMPVEKAEETKPAVSEGDKPKVRNRRAATEEVVSGDHNSKPIAVTTYLKDGEVATPNMTDSNGASVRSQTVPAGYSAKEGDWYTYAIWDLTRFNERYGTKYYARAYKRFDESTDTTVDLIDKTTGTVVETRTITASSGVQKFTTTTAASNSQLTFQLY